jgi:hypothetical protein
MADSFSYHPVLNNHITNNPDIILIKLTQNGQTIHSSVQQISIQQHVPIFFGYKQAPGFDLTLQPPALVLCRENIFPPEDAPFFVTVCAMNMDGSIVTLIPKQAFMSNGGLQCQYDANPHLAGDLPVYTTVNSITQSLSLDHAISQRVLHQNAEKLRTYVSSGGVVSVSIEAVINIGSDINNDNAFLVRTDGVEIHRLGLIFGVNVVTEKMELCMYEFLTLEEIVGEWLNFF